MPDTKAVVKFVNQNRSITTSLTDEVRAFLHKHDLHVWQALQEPLELSADVFEEFDALISSNLG